MIISFYIKFARFELSKKLNIEKDSAHWLSESQNYHNFYQVIFPPCNTFDGVTVIELHETNENAFDPLFYPEERAVWPATVSCYVTGYTCAFCPTK